MTPATRRRRRLWLPLTVVGAILFALCLPRHPDLAAWCLGATGILVLLAIGDRDPDHQGTPYEAIDQLPIGREV